MPPRISNSQRQAIIKLIDEGLPRDVIANELGVSPGQISAVAAHVTMGKYAKEAPMEQRSRQHVSLDMLRRPSERLQPEKRLISRHSHATDTKRRQLLDR